MYSIPMETVESISREISNRFDDILDQVGASFEDCTEAEVAVAVMKAAACTAEARVTIATELPASDPSAEDLGLKISGTHHTTLLTVPTFELPMVLNVMFDEAAEAILRAGRAPWELPVATHADATPEHRRLYDDFKTTTRARGIPAEVMRRTVKADTEPWIWELGKAACVYAGQLNLGCSTWSNGRRVALIFHSESDQSVAVMHHEKMNAALDDVAWVMAGAIAELKSPPPVAR